MYYYATVTPDRGDRAEFMSFCDKQLLRMEDGKVMVIKVDYPPKDNSFDLVPRFKEGLKIAQEYGIDNVIVVESDDFYNKNYYSNFDFEKYDFMGWDNTTYYNIRKRTWQRRYHGGADGHSSLCSTAFKISALDGFIWPSDNYLWLDILIWKFARQNGKRWKLFDSENPVLGIKHGVGRYGGRGHTLELPNHDHDLSFLRSKVDETAFEFYSNLKL